MAVRSQFRFHLFNLRRGYVGVSEHGDIIPLLPVNRQGFEGLTEELDSDMLSFLRGRAAIQPPLPNIKPTLKVGAIDGYPDNGAAMVVSPHEAARGHSVKTSLDAGTEREIRAPPNTSLPDRHAQTNTLKRD